MERNGATDGLRAGAATRPRSRARPRGRESRAPDRVAAGSRARGGPARWASPPATRDGVLLLARRPVRSSSSSTAASASRRGSWGTTCGSGSAGGSITTVTRPPGVASRLASGGPESGKRSASPTAAPTSAIGSSGGGGPRSTVSAGGVEHRQAGAGEKRQAWHERCQPSRGTLPLVRRRWDIDERGGARHREREGRGAPSRSIAGWRCSRQRLGRRGARDPSVAARPTGLRRARLGP